MLFKDFLRLYWEADPEYPCDFTPKADTQITINDYGYESIEEVDGKYHVLHDQYDEDILIMSPTDEMPDFQIFTLSHNNHTMKSE